MLRPVLALFLILQAASPAVSVVRIGDLDIPYDQGRWRVVKFDQALRFECANEPCRDESVSVRTAPFSLEICGNSTLSGRVPSGIESRILKVEKAALPFHVVSRDLGCRNLVSPRITACTTLGASTYRFESGPLTCQTGPGDGGDGLMALIEAAVPARQGL